VSRQYCQDPGRTQAIAALLGKDFVHEHYLPGDSGLFLAFPLGRHKPRNILGVFGTVSNY